MTFNRERQADLEDAIADQEHAVEHRLHGVADRLPDPEQVHQRAEALSEAAQRHRRRAEELRGEPPAQVP